MHKELSNISVMRRMIGLVTPLMGWMLLAILMGVAGFLCAILLPVSAIVIVAQGLGFTSGFSTSNIIIFMIVIAILRGILHYIEQACNHYIAFKLLAILRDRIFRKLRTLAPAKLEGEDKGNLISLITSDIELLEVFYAHTISPIAIGILTSLILLCMFYQMHVMFMVIALLAYLFVGLLIPLFVSRWGKAEGNAYRKGFGNLSTYTLESIRGLSDILQYKQGEQRMDGMKKQSDDLNALQANLRKYEGKSSALSGMAVQFFSILLLFCGLGLSGHGLLPFAYTLIGTLLMFSSFGPVIALSNLSNNLLVTLASGRRVLALLDETPQVEDVVNGEEAELGDLSFTNVSFAYGDEWILQEVSETFQKGKITGILGKSGSGKSTMLKLLMRFWDVNGGSVSVGERDVRHINTASLRDTQSFVTQETVLFHDSIEQNVKIANLNATHEQVVEACKKASIHEFIMSLPNGYETAVAELGDSLSGGEKQRIGIARAFLHDAPYVLLDEPTSNLDALNEGIILKSLKEQKDRTIILVSHRESTMKICDTIMKMDEGRIS